MLKLYCADVTLAPVSGKGFVLSEYRLRKLERAPSDEIRSRCIGTELLLNYAARAVLPDCTMPLDICCRKGGKPYLRSGELFFSLSHSGKYALCAVSDSEIGADIQKPAKYNKALAERFFTVDEQAWLRCSARQDRDFTKLWSQKESFIKATGQGLAQPLCSFSVLTGEGTGDWHFAHKELEEYHVAVCSKERTDAVEVLMVGIGRLTNTDVMSV